MSVLTVLSLAGNIEIYVDDQQLATFVIPKGGLNFVNPQGIGILTLYGNGGSSSSWPRQGRWRACPCRCRRLSQRCLV